ncbi:MAG: excinuclease ABC subunit UvrC [Nanoarchaeota archaeon]|nr:excinuclease ABC subunit UvrC [Nanoarchaeota archaeon]
MGPCPLHLDPKTEALVSNISSVDYIITKNEKEAFILENNLIKKNQPKYNIDLKDSKRYAYILLTDEPFPRLILARKKEGQGKFFGPFVSGEERDVLLKFANNLFRLRTCRKLPKRACLRYSMGLCTAPCAMKINETDYSSDVLNAEKLLSGKTDTLLKEMKVGMANASRSQEYEVAKVLRDRILSLEHLLEKQRVETMQKHDQHVINYIVSKGTVFLALFKVSKGILSGKEEYEFQEIGDYLEEFMLGYYQDNIPEEIILPTDINMGEYLSEKKGKNVTLTVPSRGEKKELLDLVKINLESTFISGELDLDDLKEKLNLPTPPKRIECFDISHLSGTNSVGAMVHFRDGKPDKSNYRRFKIKHIGGIDDFAMINEIVERRYSRLIKENSELPDLIIIDGGKGQLSSALEALNRLNLRIPTIGLAKQEEEVFVPGREASLVFDRKSRALKLLQRIRDETHRFAITYQKLLRGKRIKGEKK